MEHIGQCCKPFLMVQQVSHSWEQEKPLLNLARQEELFPSKELGKAFRSIQTTTLLIQTYSLKIKNQQLSYFPDWLFF